MIPHTSTMPEAETALLIDEYKTAKVILEYGSGASTKIASKMLNKRIFSVESDKAWTLALRKEISKSMPSSKVYVHHVDIGNTGQWGRPTDASMWRNYHQYPNSIWDKSFFRQPNVVLIDGRFRTACLMTTLLRTTRPVTVLFDDYVDRPKYRAVERIICPNSIHGRMARFEITPGLVKPEDMGFVIEQYFQISFQGDGLEYYQMN